MGIIDVIIKRVVLCAAANHCNLWPPPLHCRGWSRRSAHRKKAARMQGIPFKGGK
jgi:hypothetical protein